MLTNRIYRLKWVIFNNVVAELDIISSGVDKSWYLMIEGWIWYVFTINYTYILIEDNIQL